MADSRSGQGKESFADGSYHEGAWELNQPLGPGTRRDRTGIVINGLWNADQLSSGLIRLPGGAEYAGRLLLNRNKEVHVGLLQWLNTQAANNDPYAHFFLGTVYSDFDKPSRDRKLATDHFRKAAEAGISDGQFRLALLIVKDDPKQAVELLKSAAEAKQAQASTLLGQYYLSGTLVPLNVRTAIRYLRSGSSAGDMGARNNLAWVLATAMDAGASNGTEALQLIKPLALQSDDWQHLDTLAAPYAELRNFPEAMETQQRAIDKATLVLGEESDPVAAMRNHLSYYQAGEPFRE